MKPRKVMPFGALKHRERPATHNVGLVGVSCCGELILSFDPSPFRWLRGREIIVMRCECGAVVDVATVEPEEALPWADDDADRDGDEGGYV